MKIKETKKEAVASDEVTSAGMFTEPSKTFFFFFNHSSRAVPVSDLLLREET